MAEYKRHPVSRSLTCTILLCIVLSSCSIQNKSDREIKFQKLYPDIGFNKCFRQTVVRNEINQRKGPSIYLLLENLSSSKIVFPVDYGVKVYKYSEDQNEWEELKNDSVYIAESAPIIYPKEMGASRFLGVPLSPVIEHNDQNVDIRVVVVGTAYDEDKPTGELVGAYTDITLTP